MPTEADRDMVADIVGLCLVAQQSRFNLTRVQRSGTTIHIDFEGFSYALQVTGHWRLPIREEGE